MKTLHIEVVLDDAHESSADSILARMSEVAWQDGGVVIADFEAPTSIQDRKRFEECRS